MKQRVGMARALAVDPEILFMDEPFSHVDALTSESLRSEVIDLWLGRKHRLSSILLVSHDVKEVVYMATARAAGGQAWAGADGDRQQTAASARPALGGVPGAGGSAPRRHRRGTRCPTTGGAVEPLPRCCRRDLRSAGVSALARRQGGRVPLAADTRREYGDMIKVVHAAELLGWWRRRSGRWCCCGRGETGDRAPPDQVKGIWRTAVVKLGLFHQVGHALRKQPDKKLPRAFVIGPAGEESCRTRTTPSCSTRSSNGAARRPVRLRRGGRGADAGVIEAPG